MIPVLSTRGDREAERILAALTEAGIGADIVDDPSALDGAGVALVHVSRLKRLQPAANPKALIAFGGADRADVAVKTLKQGATEYLPAGADLSRVSLLIRDGITAEDTAGTVAQSEAMTNLLQLADRVAQADIAVLVSGESGTGKEVICRHIHEASPRAAGPFVAVNCAAIPETMLEAVLFGHDKGAFTGAAEQRLGKFELADGGTLLLDEITEMPVGLQAKLLRVLQEKEVERIGSNSPRKIDVRVLATSNRDLRDAVAEGVLREDLYYRLSVFPLQIPPLRERPEDIPALARHFMSKYADARAISLGPSALGRIRTYSWPGNVRELENCIQRAIVLCENGVIEAQDLGLSPQTAEISLPAAASLQSRMRESEEQLLLKILKENNGVRKATAAQLGISDRTLRYKLKQLKERGVTI